MIYLVIAIICGILGAAIADENNRLMGALMGALLGPIGLIIVAIIKGKN